MVGLLGMVELPQGFSGINTFSGFMKDTSNISFPEISIVERYCRHFLSIIPFDETSHITCLQSDCVPEDLFDIAFFWSSTLLDAHLRRSPKLPRVSVLEFFVLRVSFLCILIIVEGED